VASVIIGPARPGWMLAPALPGSSVTSGATRVLPIFRAIIFAEEFDLMLCLFHLEVVVVVLHSSRHDQDGGVAVFDHVAELGLRELLDPHGVDAGDHAGLVRRGLPGSGSSTGRSTGSAAALCCGGRGEEGNRQQNHQVCLHQVS